MKQVRLNTKLISSLNSVLFMQSNDMITATGISQTTWYEIMKHPDSITVQQLLAIANGLHIPVRRFFSNGKADLIGRRDDYVTDRYQPCRYDATTFQDIVNTRADATWKKAADATGMTSDSLKNSLLAVRRTPVMRFLIACQSFDVDPFSILVDPNSEAKQRRSKPGETDSIRADISQLRKDIETLSNTVRTLTEAYEALLKAHEQLARSVHVNIGTISGGNISTIGIAAESVMPSDDG